MQIMYCHIYGQDFWDGVLDEPQPFDLKYVMNIKKSFNDLPWVHPANFRVPIEWYDERTFTWEEWKELVGRETIKIQPKTRRIADHRYTPLKKKRSSLSNEINPIRGVGILLYELLRNNFDLPSIWNGPGYADSLVMLPKILLKDMTCSSWTLGILQGCLSPRVVENKYLNRFQSEKPLNNDTLNDPISFYSLSEVKSAIEKAKLILEEYQISTLQHNARQLIPINIKQLTYNPGWGKIFNNSEGNENV